TYDSNGNLRTTTDALGRVTTFTYDSMSRITQRIDALGHTATATYNAAGLPLSATNELGGITDWSYDAYTRGLLIGTNIGVGTQAEAVTLDGYNAAGLPSIQRDLDGGTTTYAYDPVLRVNQATDALGGVLRARYDLAGQAVASRDALGRWTLFQYN